MQSRTPPRPRAPTLPPRHASRANGPRRANRYREGRARKGQQPPPTSTTSAAGTVAALDTLLGALRATSIDSLAASESQASHCSPSRSIQPSSESQSGKAETGHANDLILSQRLSVISSTSSSSSVSDSQNAASSVLFGETHLGFGCAALTSWQANATNGCSKSCAAVLRSPAFLAKHMAKKSFASADSQTGTSGTASVYPIRWTAARTSSMSLHGARPVAISMTVQPRAQTSAAGPCSSPRATSGAMNAGVPLTGRSESMVFAHPKSASLASPSTPITMLSALTSPCTSDIPWRYVSPRRTSAAYTLIARSSRRPPSLATSLASDPPGANSRKRLYDPSGPSPPPMQGTTCGEDSPDIIPRSLLSIAASAAAAVLTANSSPDAPSSASDTTAPDAPRPSVRSRVQRPLTAIAIPRFFSFLVGVVGLRISPCFAMRCCCCWWWWW
ncbi:hypothetical protein DAI22_01g291900 [Oryza sativa Japonica Group]|nr:hypothetical protein DAI22_01g291900 [Oryza sativa Japonica Group]